MVKILELKSLDFTASKHFLIESSPQKYESKIFQGHSFLWSNKQTRHLKRSTDWEERKCYKTCIRINSNQHDRHANRIKTASEHQRPEDSWFNCFPADSACLQWQKTADSSPQPINHQLLVIRAAFSRLGSSICDPCVVV